MGGGSACGGAIGSTLGVAESVRQGSTWNEKLARLAQAEEEYARATKADGHDLSPEDRDRIHALPRAMARRPSPRQNRRSTS